ncbi:ABC transporter ATP-binding protein [Aminipila butyrica]|uniref:ABC transporter ATP-binding protein n=1 Tax=Aminipila butyrica TaxID=433296 RepID=A0A858BVD8_9FIRM|nr:ABC transporter ATP-binding protein [Aminipila butyrica]QIB68734.1 ABC transporter ATP-binding protein [Aminipila butyrica]
MFKKILAYAGEHQKTTYGAIAVMLAGMVMQVLPFWFIYQIIRPLLMRESVSAEYIIYRLAAIAACTVLYAVLYIWGLSLSHHAAYHTLKNLRISLQKKMEGLPLGVIQQKGVGAIKKMFIDDIEKIELPLAHAIPEGVANTAVPVLVFLGLFWADWRMALLALASLPLGAIAMMIMYRSGMSKMGSYYQAAQKMNSTIVEYINGMEVVKVFNRDGESYHRYENDIKSYRDFTLAWYKVCWPWMAIYNTLVPCVALFVLPVGSYFVLQGYSTLPNLALALCMSFGISAPLLRVMSFMPTMAQINYTISNMEQLMNEAPLTQSPTPFAGRNHGVSFEDVCFAYQETEVLHSITLNIPEGSLTALVGESGSGKSTLAKLLVHFYDITSGAIKVGGQDIRHMSLESLNEQISYVAQEQFLFNISLLENIRLGKPEATDQEVLAAAEKAQCGEFLARLKKGIHTLAGDSGKQLSGGERQRISLARAILKNAPIVVLDEATAFIDPENEEKMNAAIAEVISGKTVIVIAHRLHSILHADQICVLAGGTLAAAGTHTQLLSSCPAYQKLWLAAESSAQWKVSIEKGGEIL